MAEKKIGDYQLEDRGINTASYFSGAGIAFTRWDACFTGVGETPKEAADDAIEMAAQSGWDTSDVTVDENEFPVISEEPSLLHYEDCPNGSMDISNHDDDCMFLETHDLEDCTCDCECDGEAPQYYVVLNVQHELTVTNAA